MHALLQHLPEIAPENQERAARAFISARGADLAQALQDEILAETLAIIRDPRFAPLFQPGSLAEAPVVAKIGEGEDGYELEGQIDRLAILENELLILDYKTKSAAAQSGRGGGSGLYRPARVLSPRAQAIVSWTEVACSLAVDRRTQPHGNPINFA